MATISGTAGADTITPGFVSPGVLGGAPSETADSVTGDLGNDSISAAGGDDLLDGGSGTDTLAGGSGDDTYLVDSFSDQVIEATGGGSDTVMAAANFALAPGQEIETLQLLGTAVYGAGNELANVILGTTADNVLVGGDGNDYLIDSPGDDILIGDAGNDTLSDFFGSNQLLGGLGDDLYVVVNNSFIDDGGGADTVEFQAFGESVYSMPAGIETLRIVGPTDVTAFGNLLANHVTGSDASNQLIGEDGDDTILGGALSDRLEGGAGDDSLDGRANGSGDIMIGDTGNDRYAVDSVGDQVIEFAGEGSDTVTATASCTLPGFVEDLILAGAAPLAGTGNADANRVTGNTADNLLDGAGGNDTLSGGKGDDTLIGGAGADLLVGGKGRDVFRFLTPGGVADTIKGYSGRKDAIEVSAAGFGGDLVAGMTMAGEGRFTVNDTGAPDGFLAQFILNTATGLLRWDADGINDISAVDVAVLPGAKGLTGAEILVIA